MSNQDDEPTGLEPEALWKKIRNYKVPLWLWIRWGGAIVAFMVYVGPYMQALAEGAVVNIMRENKDFKEMQQAIGSIQSNINTINNTLTINAARAIDADKDREETKAAVNRLVEFIINKKVELTPINERSVP